MMDSRSRISEEQARRLWERAAELQAEADRKKEEEEASKDDPEAGAGQSAPDEGGEGSPVSGITPSTDMAPASSSNRSGKSWPGSSGSWFGGPKPPSVQENGKTPQ